MSIAYRDMSIFGFAGMMRPSVISSYHQEALATFKSRDIVKAFIESEDIGEVQNTTSHLYDAALTRNDYLRLSGGTTKKSDERRIHRVG